MSEQPLLTEIGNTPLFEVQEELRSAMAVRSEDRNTNWSWWTYRFVQVLQFVLGVGLNPFEKDLVKLKAQLDEDEQAQQKWQENMANFRERVANRPRAPMEPRATGVEIRNLWPWRGNDAPVNLAQAVLENLDWIPSHLNNIYVFDVVRRVASVEGEKSMIHFLSDHVVGPAVRKVFAANVLLWSCYLVFPWLAYWPSRHLPHAAGLWRCEGGNFASYNPLFLAIYMVLVLVLLIIELQALVFVLPPQVAIIGPFMKNFARKDWSFYIFTLGMTSMSIVAHMDLASNALFLAKVLATNNCPDPMDDSNTALGGIELYWSHVWKKSFWHIEPPKFQSTLVVVWVLLFFQLIYALLSSVPVSTEVDSNRRWPSADGLKALLGLGAPSKFYEIRDRDLGGKKYGFYTYPTVLHPRTQHSASLMALAEAARMYTLRFNGWSYKNSFVERNLYKSGQVYKDVKTTVFYFCYFLLFENLVQLELQSTALEVGVAMTPEHKVDKQIVLSLALSFINAVYNLYSTCSKMWSQARACRIAPTDERNPACQRYNERAKKWYLPITVFVFVILVVVYAGFLAHALAKTIMVSRVCNCGWNVPFDFTSGCVGELSAGTCHWK